MASHKDRIDPNGAGIPGNGVPAAGSPKTRRAGWRWNMAQALERRWWRNYLRGRTAVEYRAWKHEYWLKLLEPHQHALGLERPQRILDAGCGPAGINLVLKRHSVVAIDPLLELYAAELPLFAELRVEGVEYQCSTLESHRPATHYDGAFCMNAINHVEDLDAALNALTAVVKTGGWMLLGVDVHRSEFLKTIFRVLPGDALHPHQHNAAEYRTMLETRGWKIMDYRIEKPGRIFDYAVFRAVRATDGKQESP